LENNTNSSKKVTTPESDGTKNTSIEKLKFEVGQEMGIKPKPKTKNN
jgi:hypothetical protein